MLIPDLPPNSGAKLTQALQFVRSSLWFDDGNIILVAIGSAAFKVHRGQLERHSEVFSDLFSIPQPDDQELLEGCCIVEIHDQPSDVFCLLSALYDGLSVFLLPVHFAAINI